jgi:hypothetical protein
MNTEFSKLYFACHAQKEAVELIHFLDKKAALFVTASAAILGFVNSYLTKPPGLLYIVAALAFVSLGISLVAGFYCVVPRIARNRPKFDDDWIKDNCESTVTAQVHELWVDTGGLQKNIIDQHFG